MHLFYCLASFFDLDQLFMRFYDHKWIDVSSNCNPIKGFTYHDVFVL